MKVAVFAILSLLLTVHPLSAAASDKTQVKLDEACEAARQKKLLPLRKELVDTCVTNKELPSRTECEQEYASYGAHVGARQPLFFDLPECVAALDHQRAVRNPDA